MKTSINRRIVQNQNAIENAINQPEILSLMSIFGYDRKKLRIGKVNCEQANLLQLAKQKKYGSQFDATDTLKGEFEAVKIQYDEHRALAKLAFKGQRGTLEKLQLNGARKRNKEEWIAQAMAFYNSSAEIEEVIGRYGVSPEALAQTKAMLEALSSARQQQLQKIGEAQSATQKRDEAIKTMDTWMKEFRSVARIALKDNPQLLEALGIKVPSKV